MHEVLARGAGPTGSTLRAHERARALPSEAVEDCALRVQGSSGSLVQGVDARFTLSLADKDSHLSNGRKTSLVEAISPTLL